MRYERLGDLLRLAFKLAGTAEGLCLDEIAQEFGLSRRTAERMLGKLRDVFPELREAEPDDRRKRWRLPNSALRGMLAAEAAELAELDAAARRLRQEGAPAARIDALERLGDKVRASMQPRALRRAELDVELQMETEGTAVRPGPRPLIAADVVGNIREALLKFRRLRLLYAAGGATERHRTVEPLGLLWGQRPYLVARLVGLPPDPSLMRLDRIRQIEILPEPFTRDPDFSLDAFAARAFGVFQEPPFAVCLRFSAEAATDASSFHFHPSQQLQPLADGRLLVRFTAGGLQEMCQHLATWNDHVEVLKPVRLRKELARWTQDVADHHHKQPITKSEDPAR